MICTMVLMMPSYTWIQDPIDCIPPTPSQQFVRTERILFLFGERHEFTGLLLVGSDLVFASRKKTARGVYYHLKSVCNQS